MKVIWTENNRRIKRGEDFETCTVEEAVTRIGYLYPPVSRVRVSYGGPGCRQVWFGNCVAQAFGCNDAKLLAHIYN